MSYAPDKYRSKNVYLPKILCNQAEKRAAALFMNFTVYVRKLIVEDLQKTRTEDASALNIGS